MGFWGTFVMLTLPLDILYLFMSGYDSVMGVDLPDQEKMHLVFRCSSLALLGVAGIFAGLGLVEVLRGPRIKAVSIPVTGLHPALEGLRIVQISDLHVGPTIRRAYVEDVVRRTNALAADFICLTGDIGDARAVSITANLASLAGLKSRYGVFYVTGNHEYYWGAEELIAEFKKLGFQPLLNENRVIPIGVASERGDPGQSEMSSGKTPIPTQAKVLIAGVTDPMGERFFASHKPDAEAALRSAESTQFKILLAHRPGVFKIAEPLGFDLQLSGHTHAGQFFPFSMLVRLVHLYYKGLNHPGRLWLYVNPGTGYWGPANRFQVASEITLLRLVGATT